MEGTNIETGNIDTDIAHDHSYYGNGCSNDQYPSGEDGSPVSCSTRIVRDYNNENQKNGTYYTFQAVTSGTGGAMTTDNANSSDTFCPLGWQLPYSGTGGDYYDKSKSWNYLLTTYNIAFNDGATSDTTKVRSYPFSYIDAGNYRWGSGRLYTMNTHGHYWSSTVSHSYNSYLTHIWSTGIEVSRSLTKHFGFPLRCTSELVS